MEFLMPSRSDDAETDRLVEWQQSYCYVHSMKSIWLQLLPVLPLWPGEHVGGVKTTQDLLQISFSLQQLTGTAWNTLITLLLLDYKNKAPNLPQVLHTNLMKYHCWQQFRQRRRLKIIPLLLSNAHTISRMWKGAKILKIILFNNTSCKASVFGDMSHITFFVLSLKSTIFPFIWQTRLRLLRGYNSKQ